MTPSFVAMTYGPSGVGKTTDQGYSFPNALFAAAPGALNSIQSVCGYLPATVQVHTLQEATKLIKSVSGKFKVLVIDDFSFMAEQTFGLLEKKYKGYDLWGALRSAALDFRNQARLCEVSVVMNAWEQGPKIKQGTKVRGGPALSGNLPEQIPALCDTVLRATQDVRRQPWPAVYRCYKADPSWTTKDRFDIATLVDPCPMNIAELLRASGMEIERHPDLPGQEEQVEVLAQHFMAEADPLASVNDLFQQLVGSGIDVKVVRWTLRDALDRAEIRKALTTAQGTFIQKTSTLL
jgi:hypothetical protein